MGPRLDAFREFRQRMNERVLAGGTTETRRFFALDSRCYEDGALPRETKELLGLVASLVLRCDDCVTYHLIEATRAGRTRAEIVETLDVGLIVGGSIVIPHLRRAYEVLDELEQEAAAPPPRA
jgi:AhpD family alkylhydroperoxidase